MAKRYMGAFEDIIKRHYVDKDIEKQVIVIVSHHKAVDMLSDYA
jgi:hypothetical protein